jgi:hypothetical protein
MINSIATNAVSKMGATELDCVKFHYTYQKWGTDGARIANTYYTNAVIACPIDSAYSSDSTVTIKPFTAPSDWGSTTDFTNLFHLTYSNMYGNLVLANASKSKNPTASACTATAATPTFAKSVNN